MTALEAQTPSETEHYQREATQSPSNRLSRVSRSKTIHFWTAFTVNNSLRVSISIMFARSYFFIAICIMSLVGTHTCGDFTHSVPSEEDKKCESCRTSHRSRQSRPSSLRNLPSSARPPMYSKIHFLNNH